jgi:hypothetical protein
MALLPHMGLDLSIAVVCSNSMWDNIAVYLVPENVLLVCVLCVDLHMHSITKGPGRSSHPSATGSSGSPSSGPSVSEVLPAVCDTWWGFRAWQLRRERLQEPSALSFSFNWATIPHIRKTSRFCTPTSMKPILLVPRAHEL